MAYNNVSEEREFRVSHSDHVFIVKFFIVSVCRENIKGVGEGVVMESRLNLIKLHFHTHSLRVAISLMTPTELLKLYDTLFGYFSVVVAVFKLREGICLAFFSFEWRWHHVVIIEI